MNEKKCGLGFDVNKTRLVEAKRIKRERVEDQTQQLVRNLILRLSESNFDLYLRISEFPMHSKDNCD